MLPSGHQHAFEEQEGIQGSFFMLTAQDLYEKYLSLELVYLLLCDFTSKAKLSTVGFGRGVSQFSRVWAVGWSLFFHFWKAVL